MILTFSNPGFPEVQWDAILLEGGNQRAIFKGPIPVSPGPFQYPPIPDLPPLPEDSPIQFRVFTHSLPDATVSFTHGKYLYLCAVGEVTSETFELLIHGMANLKAIERLKIQH